MPCCCCCCCSGLASLRAERAAVEQAEKAQAQEAYAASVAAKKALEEVRTSDLPLQVTRLILTVI
jgi:hypothetical protein